MTPSEEAFLQATFKSALVMIRHCVDTVESESQAEFMYRELDQQSHKLTPKFRKGNALSSMLAKNRLAKDDQSVIHSASG